MGSKAADKQAGVGKGQIAESRRQFDITRQDTAPYREAGTESLNMLRKLLGGGQVTPEMMGPGYEFRKSEGENALRNYLGRTGMKLSGRGVKEATRYGQDYASGEYGNYLARLFQLAGFGPQATSQSSYMGSQVAGSPGYNTMAQAAGGGPAAWNNAIQGGLSNYFAYKQNQDLMNALGTQNG
jgi:hypothetical protein